jgi:hypothetical protein
MASKRVWVVLDGLDEEVVGVHASVEGAIAAERLPDYPGCATMVRPGGWQQNSPDDTWWNGYDS